MKQKLFLALFGLGVLVCGLFMFGTVAKAGWETQALESDYSISGQDNAIALDSQGNPAVVYDYEGKANEQWVYQLKYAKKTTNGWTTEVIETTTTAEQGIGWRASLVLDSNNQPHVAYFQKENWESKTEPRTASLKYAKKTENGWQKETVLSFTSPFLYNSYQGPSLSRLTTIQLDAIGNPAIVYNGGYLSEEITYKTRYVYKDTTWHVETLLSDVMCEDATFVFDSNNKPHVIAACRDNYITENEQSYEDAIIYHTWKNEDEVWQSEETIDKNKVSVDGGYNYYKHLSIARDSANNLYVLYHDMGNKTLKFAENSTGTWKTEVIDNNFIKGNETINIYFKNSIAVDSDNYPRIAYYDFITSNLKYAIKTDAGWVFQTLFAEPINNEGGLPSLTIDNSGNTHMSHIGKSSSSDYVVKYTHYFPENTFVTETNGAGALGQATNEKVVVKNSAYLVNNFVLSFLKLPKKLQAKKYYIKTNKYAKYPAKYANAKKKTLKKYWKVTTNLKNYKAGKAKNKYSLRLMFAYDQSEFTALQKQNKKVKEKQLKLKYYNTTTKKWTNVPKIKQNTIRNFFYVTLANYKYPLNTKFAIGK